MMTFKKTEGDYDETLGMLQKKYGLAKEQASKKLDELLKNIKN